MRTKRVDALIEEVEVETEEITKSLGNFTEGTRCLFLILRKKDGGHNKETKRIFRFEVFNDQRGFMSALKRFLVLHYTVDEGTRIYLSVNRRDVRKAIRHLEESLLDAHYDGEENRLLTYQAYLKSSRKHLMQVNSRAETLFLLDIDNEDGKDKHGMALRKIGELGLEIKLQMRTKNGWHIIVNPFNPALWDSSIGEIKKDGLLCIKF